MVYSGHMGDLFSGKRADPVTYATGISCGEDQCPI
jgi:hypothetical protein